MFKPGQSGNPAGRVREKPFRDALLLAIKEATADNDRLKLRAVAEALVDKALEGDVAAIKEVADRLDGKVPQTNIMQGDDEGGPVRHLRVERIVIDLPSNTDGPRLLTAVKAG